MKTNFKLNRSVPIWRDAEDLLLKIEQAVVKFPRKFKYSLGQELRQSAMLICRMVSRAWRLRKQAKNILHKLTLTVDDLKIQLQLAKNLQAFSHFAEYEILARLAHGVGKQSGGWLKRVSAS